MIDYEFYKVEHDLKPCPFCGEVPTIFGHGWLEIRCHPCECSMEHKTGRRNSESDVTWIINKWNTRAKTQQCTTENNK